MNNLCSADRVKSEPLTILFWLTVSHDLSAHEGMFVVQNVWIYVHEVVHVCNFHIVSSSALGTFKLASAGLLTRMWTS